MSSSWDYSHMPPASSRPQAKKTKKRMNNELTASFLLPRLDDMVLFKPITIPCDDRDYYRDLGSMERTRMANIGKELERYNRWLEFAERSSSETKIRSTAVDLQRSVRDINLTISNMMLEIDQKILTLQDHTNAFIEAVQDGNLWQKTGSLLDLCVEELDVALAKHPQRNTDAQRKYLSELVRKQADPYEKCWGNSARRYSGRLAPKLMRLVREVRSCPGGDQEAFHLYVFLVAHVFYVSDSSDPFGVFDMDMDSKDAEDQLLRIAREHRQGALDGTKSKAFFNFALAKRNIWNALPTDCLTRTSQTHPYDPNDPLYVPSYPPCRRSTLLSLIERLQIEAYGEIRSGVMLTLTSKLPKELCLIIFEFAMANEEIDIDPVMFEKCEAPAENRDDDQDDDRDQEDGDSIRTSRLRWTVKSKYRCRHTGVDYVPSPPPPPVWT